MIRNHQKFQQWLPALFDGEFHWDFIRPAFKGTKIEPMDYDAVVERNGHRLIMETKESGKSIPIGQQITLTNEWRLGATILHIEGKSPSTISGYACYMEGWYAQGLKVGCKDIKQCNWTDLLYLVRCWFCAANDLATPTREEWDRELWLWDYERGMK